MHQDKIQVIFNSESDVLKFQQLDLYTQLKVNAKNVPLGFIFEVTDIEDAFVSLSSLVSKYKITPTKIEVMQPTLEDLFMEVIK